MPKANTVTLSIYTTAGQFIRTLINGNGYEGVHSVLWGAKDEFSSRVSSGMYVYVLRAGEVVLQNKMVLKISDFLSDVPGISKVPGMLV